MPVEKAVVVRIRPLGMVGRRVREEERKRKGVMVEDLRIRRPRYDPTLIAYQSYGFALPGIVRNLQRDPHALGKVRGHTRYWPSRRVSRLSIHDQRGTFVGKTDSLNAGGRASWNIFLLWFFENARRTIDLAATTWRLGPGRDGTVSGSLCRHKDTADVQVPRLHNGSFPYDRQYRRGHRASECGPTGAGFE